VRSWSEALASNETRNEAPDTAEFDEDVQRLLGAEFSAPKPLTGMSAEDVADRVASERVRRVFCIARAHAHDCWSNSSHQALRHYHQYLKCSDIHGQAVALCNSDELHELLLDAEKSIPGGKFESNHRSLILEKLMALKPNAPSTTAMPPPPQLQFDTLGQVRRQNASATMFL
jgi:hypothetical protein